MKKSLTSICVLSLFAATSAIAAGSVRIGGGSMRAGSLKTMPMSEQSVSTTDTSRMALSKSSSSLSKKLSDVVRVKETQKPTISQQSTDVKALESRMADLQDALEKANDKLDNMYTKEELDARLPRYDKENNRLTWIDPLAGLINVPVGAVVIDGDDVVVVDGVLNTTSVHPIQNQAVANALNNKQNTSTTLSLGAQNGEWSPITEDAYIHLYPGQSGATGIGIKPDMITNNIDGSANAGALVTAYAVQQALDEITATGAGSGNTSVPVQKYFYITDVFTRYDGLVTRYEYRTNASSAEIFEYVRDEICNGTISEKWCAFEQPANVSEDERIFYITKRKEGYFLFDYSFNNVDGTEYYTHNKYFVNIPDNVNPVSYATEHFCANKDVCYVTDIFDLNGIPSAPLYEIWVFSIVTRLTELPRAYNEE